MKDSAAEYRAISSSENQVYHSDVHEAGVSGDEFYSTSERLSGAVQTKWTYFILGCAILLPWSALANGTTFFLSRLAGSQFYPNFSSYCSTIYTFTKLISQFYYTFTLKESFPTRGIFASMIALTLLLTSLCLSTFMRATPSAFFAFTLINATLMAGINGYFSITVYAGAALLGAPFLRTVFSGHAAIGVVVSAVQVVSSIIALQGSHSKFVLMAGDNSDDVAEEISARIFFGVSVIFLCIALAAFTWLTKQPFYISVTGALEQRGRGVGRPDERTGLIAQDHRNPSAEPNLHVYQVFRKNLIFMFSLTYVFTVTLSVFPAITIRVQPVNPGIIHPLLFTAVHFLVFNVGDVVGRYSCSFPCLVVWSEKKILAMSLLRTLFIPLVLLCNVDRLTTPSALPIIRSDTLFMIIILMLGYTTGYVSTLALIAASSLEHNPKLEGRRENVDIAATLGDSCIVLGLAVGAFSSFGVQAMV